MTIFVRILWATLLSAVIVGCAIYGKLHANLYSENFRIAQSLYKGTGFANASGHLIGSCIYGTSGGA